MSYETAFNTVIGECRNYTEARRKVYIAALKLARELGKDDQRRELCVTITDSEGEVIRTFKAGTPA